MIETKVTVGLRFAGHRNHSIAKPEPTSQQVPFPAGYQLADLRSTYYDDDDLLTEDTEYRKLLDFYLRLSTGPVSDKYGLGFHFWIPGEMPDIWQGLHGFGVDSINYVDVSAKSECTRDLFDEDGKDKPVNGYQVPEYWSEITSSPREQQYFLPMYSVKPNRYVCIKIVLEGDVDWNQPANVEHKRPFKIFVTKNRVIMPDTDLARTFNRAEPLDTYYDYGLWSQATNPSSNEEIYREALDEKFQLHVGYSDDPHPNSPRAENRKIHVSTNIPGKVILQKEDIDGFVITQKRFTGVSSKTDCDRELFESETQNFLLATGDRVHQALDYTYSSSFNRDISVSKLI